MDNKQKRKAATEVATTLMNLSGEAREQMMTWMEGYAAGYNKRDREEAHEAQETQG